MSRLRAQGSDVALAALILLGAASDRTHAVETESQDAYEIVTAATVPILPQPLRPYFRTHLERISAAAVQNICPRPISDANHNLGHRHYITLDAATGMDDVVAREAARRFPRDREAAESLFARHSLRNGGSLPWVLLDSHNALREAFRSGDRERIASEAGILLHFATDAALPFNTAGARRPVEAGQSEGAHDPPSVGPPDDLARQRYHVRMIRRFRDRLAYEVRVWPKRLGSKATPIETVFDTLIEAHDAAEQLLRIEHALHKELGVTTAGAGRSTGDPYSQRLAQQAAPILESQLEAGALLGAALIRSAWAEAGRPATLPAGQSDHRLGGASPPLVGSRHSTKVHEAACQHARRINPQNRVYFDTPRDAKQAGRTPCKSCDPFGL